KVPSESAPEFQRPSAMQEDGQGPDVVVWPPPSQTHSTVVPGETVETLEPDTSSENWLPWRPTYTRCVGPGVGFGVGNGAARSCAPTTKMGSVVWLSMTAA